LDRSGFGGDRNLFRRVPQGERQPADIASFLRGEDDILLNQTLETGERDRDRIVSRAEVEEAEKSRTVRRGGADGSGILLGQGDRSIRDDGVGRIQNYSYKRTGNSLAENTATQNEQGTDQQCRVAKRHGKHPFQD